VGAAAPLQQAGVLALSQPEEYYRHLSEDYGKRRDTLLRTLEDAGFRCFRPHGAYYIMTDIQDFGFADDMAMVRHLIEDVGVAAVPGSSFFSNPAQGSNLIRFCFCKKYETLVEAGNRLRKFSGTRVR
jgi:aminotransferase